MERLRLLWGCIRVEESTGKEVDGEDNGTSVAMSGALQSADGLAASVATRRLLRTKFLAW